LEQLTDLRDQLSGGEAALLRRALAEMDGEQEIVGEIRRVLVDRPPPI